MSDSVSKNSTQTSDAVSKNAVLITSLRTEINVLQSRLLVAYANLSDSQQNANALNEQVSTKTGQLEEAVYEINKLKAKLDFLENENMYLKTKAHKSLDTVLNGGRPTAAAAPPPPPPTPAGTPVKEVFPPFCCCVM